MGSGSGKQPKIKKIYVKSADALSEEKRWEEKMGRQDGKTIGEFVYLPFQVRGATVIVKEGIFWRVTNEYLQSTAEMIGCRSTKNLEDMAGEGAGILYNSLIQGVDDGDGWLRLELKAQVNGVHTDLPEHSTSASSTAASPTLENDPIPVCAIAKVTIPEIAIAKEPSDLDHPTSAASIAITPLTKVHEPDRSSSTALGAVVASSASSVAVQAVEKPVAVSPERVYLREMADPVVDASLKVTDPVADTKPTVSDKTAPKAAAITKELNPFRKETFPLSARSFSSDEGDQGEEGTDEADPIPVEIPKKVPQAAFADVLKEGYERRANERSNWLNSLSESQGPVKASEKFHGPMRTFGAESLRFNQTRLAPPVLRDPDIFEQVRKQNLDDPRYKARDEMPVNRPVIHMY